VEGEEQPGLFQGGVIMKRKQVILIDELRKDSRQSLTSLSNRTGVPLSTVFKLVDRLHKNNVIGRDVSLLDFSQLGFPVRIAVFIKADEKNEVRKFLEEHPSANTLLRLSGDFDFYAEMVFENMLGYEDFAGELERFEAKSMSMHFLEDVKQEEFRFGE
jgi:DNA-binding Lrp family transcriptional regulator